MDEFQNVGSTVQIGRSGEEDSSGRVERVKKKKDVNHSAHRILRRLETVILMKKREVEVELKTTRSVLGVTRGERVGKFQLF